MTMIRLVAAGTLLAASLAGSNAFAQGSYVHHAFCLQRGSGTECAYDSMAQCEAARSGDSSGSCVPNSAPINHRQ
jgi:hypothetical protein